MPETVRINAFDILTDTLLCTSHKKCYFCCSWTLCFVVLQDMNISRAAAHVVHFRSVIYELPFCLRCPNLYWQWQSNWMSFIFNEIWWFEATETLNLMYLNTYEQRSDAVTANSDQDFTSLTSVLEVFFLLFSISLVTRLKQGYCVIDMLNYSSVKNWAWHGWIQKLWHSIKLLTYDISVK